MFYERFLELCHRKGVAPTRAAIEAGISKSLVSKWKSNEAKEPSPEVIRKLANYFDISKFEVLEDRPSNKNAPVLTEKDERDIEKRMEALLEDLENGQGSLAFSGEALDDETRELLIKSLRNSMEVGKALAKKKYTPKKYRKE